MDVLNIFYKIQVKKDTMHLFNLHTYIQIQIQITNYKYKYT